jgi:DNA-binding NtrC family response regulator
MKGPFTVVIVDDEAAIRKALKRVLKYEPYQVVDFGDPTEALDYVRANPAHLVISDHTMPGMLGIELLRKIRLFKPDTIRIMLTGNANLDMAMAAINDGAIYRFLTKPWENNDLLLAVRLGLRQYETESENRRLLALVKKHQDVLEQLERQTPGITGLKRTQEGRIVIDDQDIEEALAELEKFGQ